MSRKTFTTAPKPKQPSVESIDAYETGGAGHDSHSASPLVRDQTNKAYPEPTKRLSLDLPASTHTRFKTACSASGRKMVAEIQAFVEQRTKELEKEVGITRK